MDQLKINPQFGIHVKKEQIPSFYVKKYNVGNLWKCDLANFWRMIYWIDGSGDINIISFVMDIINHKEYNKRFGYKKN